MKAWNILHSDCAQTALELVKYQHIICQLFAPDGNLEVCKALLAGHSYAQAAYLGWEVLKEDMLVWCVTHQPFHAWQQQFQAGSPPHQQALLHPQYRPGAFQLWQVQQEGRVLFYSQVLGPRLWWRKHRQGLTISCTNGPVISSEFTPLYDQLSHTTL